MRRTLPLIVACIGLACARTQARWPFVVAPGAVVTGVDVVDVSFADMALTARVRITNPGPEPLLVPSCEWTLSVADEPLFGAVHEEPVTVPPHGFVAVDVPIAFHLGDLQTSPAAGAGGIPYTLNITPGGGTPATHQGVLHVPTAPVVTLRGVRVRQLTWREATVQVDVGIRPRTGGSLRLRAVDCGLWLEGRHIADFRAHAVDVPIAGETRVPLVSHVELGPRGQATAALLQRAEARFTLRGYAAVDTGAFGVLSLQIDETGVIALIPPAA